MTLAAFFTFVAIGAEGRFGYVVWDLAAGTFLARALALLVITDRARFGDLRHLHVWFSRRLMLARHGRSPVCGTSVPVLIG